MVHYQFSPFGSMSKSNKAELSNSSISDVGQNVSSGAGGLASPSNSQHRSSYNKRGGADRSREPRDGRASESENTTISNRISYGGPDISTPGRSGQFSRGGRQQPSYQKGRNPDGSQTMDDGRKPGNYVVSSPEISQPSLPGMDVPAPTMNSLPPSSLPMGSQGGQYPLPVQQLNVGTPTPTEEGRSVIQQQPPMMPYQGAMGGKPGAPIIMRQDVPMHESVQNVVYMVQQPPYQFFAPGPGQSPPRGYPQPPNMGGPQQMPQQQRLSANQAYSSGGPSPDTRFRGAQNPQMMQQQQQQQQGMGQPLQQQMGQQLPPQQLQQQPLGQQMGQPMGHQPPFLRPQQYSPDGSQQVRLMYPPPQQRPGQQGQQPTYILVQGTQGMPQGMPPSNMIMPQQFSPHYIQHPQQFSPPGSVPIQSSPYGKPQGYGLVDGSQMMQAQGQSIPQQQQSSTQHQQQQQQQLSQPSHMTLDQHGQPLPLQPVAQGSPSTGPLDSSTTPAPPALPQAPPKKKLVIKTKTGEAWDGEAVRQETLSARRSTTNGSGHGGGPSPLLASHTAYVPSPPFQQSPYGVPVPVAPTLVPVPVTSGISMVPGLIPLSPSGPEPTAYLLPPMATHALSPHSPVGSVPQAAPMTTATPLVLTPDMTSVEPESTESLSGSSSQAAPLTQVASPESVEGPGALPLALPEQPATAAATRCDEASPSVSAPAAGKGKEDATHGEASSTRSPLSSSGSPHVGECASTPSAPEPTPESTSSTASAPEAEVEINSPEGPTQTTLLSSPASAPALAPLSIALPVDPVVSLGAGVAKIDVASSPVPSPAPVSTPAPAAKGVYKPPTPVSAPSPVPSKSKFKSKRDMLAAADAASERVNMLDAYTVSAPAPVAAAPVPAPAPAVVEKAPEVVEAQPEAEDDWEVAADKIEQGSVAIPAPTPAPAPAPARRSLRPGGGLGSQRLNAGPASMQANMPKKVYSREDIMHLRPQVQPEPPENFIVYGSIITVEEGKGGAPTLRSPVGQKPTGFWQRAEIRQQEQQQQQQRHKDLPMRESPAERGSGGHDDGRNSWTREPLVPPQASQMAQGHYTKGGRGPKNVPVARPQKVITDMREALSVEVMSILNKITPQTFEKLTSKLCEIDIPSESLLDRLIELVFEKAIQEPNFANLYAEMCFQLDDASKFWAFLQIADNRDMNQFFWIKELHFDRDLAGPFGDVEQCVDAVMSGEPLVMRPVNFKVQVEDIIVKNNILVKVFRNVSEGSAAAPAEFYLSHMPFLDVNQEMMSENIFESRQLAQRDATSKNSVKRRLVNLCQEEFMLSTSEDGPYSKKLVEQREFKAGRGDFKPEDRAMRELEIESSLNKLKKRMLGNIKFVGELYKKSLISTKIMFKCIKHLIAEVDENDDITGWKPIPNEQDLELLCKFLHTVGSTLEGKAKTNGSHQQELDWHFGQLLKYSKDKAINSRIRFNIQEVLELRSKGWQARREQEGPVKLEEIHQKIAQEENAKLMQQQQMFGNQQHGKRNAGPQAGFDRGAPTAPGGYGGRGPSGDQRAAQGGEQRLPGQGFGRTISFDRMPNSGTQGHGRGVGGDARGASDSRDSGRPPLGRAEQGGELRRSYSDGPGAAAYAEQSEGGRIAPLDRTRRPSGSERPAESSSRGGGRSSGVERSLPLRVGSMVDEFLSQKDWKEVEECMNELPQGCILCLVQTLATKLQGARVHDKQSLEELIDKLGSYFHSDKAGVEEALSSYEALLQLHDTVMDCQDAPESIGFLAGKLIKHGVYRLATLIELVDKFQAGALADPYLSPEADVQATFQRFVDAAKKASK